MTELLSTKEAAQAMRLSVRALEDLRRDGKGPAYVRLSARCIRYPRRLVEQYLEKHLVRTYDQQDAAIAQ
jgi:predicted DNA-binding transcriptional regulator AlpA